MTDTWRILRFEVPVDDQDHDLALPGHIVHIDSTDPHVVELWVDTGAPNDMRDKVWRVFATGQEIPIEYQHARTVIVPIPMMGSNIGQRLVWHLCHRQRETAR